MILVSELKKTKQSETDELFQFEHLSPEDVSAPETYEVCNVADSAFGGENLPSFRDTTKHVIDGDRVLLLKYDDQPIGFSSARFNPDLDDSLESECVVHHAAAVHPEFQGEGFSRLLSSLSTIPETVSETEEYVVAGRTTHPAFVKHYGMQEKIDDPKARKRARKLTSLWPGELKDGFVLKGSFDNDLYSGEEFDAFQAEISGLTDTDYEPRNGDAFIVYESTTPQEKLDSALQAAEKCSAGDRLYEEVRDAF